MYEKQRTFNFFDLPKTDHKVYGSPEQQALLFEDIIPWPDPNINKNFYSVAPFAFDSDEKNIYNVNKMYMREPELKANVDLLTIGCSNSFGVGLPIDMIWPEMVSKHFGLTYANTSVAGSSIMSQIINAFHYFKIFGNPKIILCMFPNFERSRLFVDNKTTRFINEGKDVLGPMHVHTGRLKERPRFVEFPVGKDDFIGQPQAFYNNTLFIFILEQYCKSNNIKLIWSTWATYDHFDVMFNKAYENYKTEDGGLYHEKFWDCKMHESLRDKFPDLFDEGYDIQHHPGVHWHTHISEFFINELNKELP